MTVTDAFLFEASDLKKFVQDKAKAKSVTVRSTGNTAVGFMMGMKPMGSWHTFYPIILIEIFHGKLVP